MGLIPPAAPRLRRLCAEADIPEGGAKGFPPPPGGFTGLFAVRAGGRIAVYVNACPHLGVPLDWAPNRFLSVDGRHIVCATHRALFRLQDGGCVHGPCYGAALEPVLIEINAGAIWVPEDAAL